MPSAELNELFVKTRKPTPGKQITYFDTHRDGRGLVLTVNPKGSKTWSALYYVRGKPRYKKLGRYPILSLKQAREAARIFLADPQKAMAARNGGTFKEVAENFLKRHVEANHLRSQSEIEWCLRKYIYPKWQDRPFREIRRVDVAELLDKIEDGSGARQADMCLAIIRKMANWFATRDDDYVSPIVRGMRRIKPKERARERILNDDELRAVWKACDDFGSSGRFVKLLLLTAQRRTKVGTMKWSDLADDVWTIATEAREKGNAGELRLPQTALDLIEEQPHLADNPYVFAAAVGEGASNSFSQWKEDLDAMLPKQMPHWQFHDLRRTARSLMSRANVRPDIAERVLGHAIPGVEGIYDRHRYTKEKAEALEALAKVIEQIIYPSNENVVQFVSAGGR